MADGALGVGVQAQGHVLAAVLAPVEPGEDVEGLFAANDKGRRQGQGLDSDAPGRQAPEVLAWDLASDRRGQECRVKVWVEALDLLGDTPSGKSRQFAGWPDDLPGFVVRRTGCCDGGSGGWCAPATPCWLLASPVGSLERCDLVNPHAGQTSYAITNTERIDANASPRPLGYDLSRVIGVCSGYV